MLRKLIVITALFVGSLGAQSYTLLLQDTFTRANGAVGNGWTDVDSRWSITSHVAAPTFTGDSNIGSAHLVQTSTFVNGKVRIYPNPGGQHTMIGLLRWADKDNCYYAYVFSDNQIHIGKRVSGSFTELFANNSEPSFPSSGAWYMEFSITGNSLTVAVYNLSGGLVASETTTDSSISAAGKWGLAGYDTSGTIEVDGYSQAVSGPLVAGSISKVSDTATSVTLSASDASGGTPAYTYQWYRSTVNGFTPGVGNLLAGQNSLSLSDTGLTASGTYYYVVGYTDSAGTPATVYSAQFTEALPTTVIGFIGDSITLGTGGTTTAPTWVRSMLDKTGTVNALYSVVNQGVSGTTSGDWVSGSGNLNTAISAFSTAAVTHVFIMLGTNDSKTGVATASSTYQTRLQGMIAALKSAGFGKIVLNYAPYINSGGSWDTTSSNALLVQYQASLVALAAADPTHVFVGDALAYQWFSSHTSELGDGVHPNDTGYVSLGYLWTQAYVQLFSPRGSSGSSFVSVQ